MTSQKYPLIAAILLMLGAQGVAAQGLGILKPDDDTPLQIDSDDGIEWREDERVYFATGNVRAARGDVSVYADKLTAHYRKGAEGKTEVWRLNADGNVRITSTNESVSADNGVYDVDQGVLVLTGREMILKTATANVTARDSLEYYDRDKYMVARGQAYVVQDDKRLRADVLVAFMRENADGKSRIHLVRAFDNVHLSTAQEIVQCRRAEYNLDTGVAILLGSVKITREENQLNGERAEINVKTGASRLLGAGGSGSSGRVHGIFIPRKGNLDSKSGEQVQ